jgi:hypothetical protein
MKIKKVLVQHCDWKMLPIHDDPTQMSRVRHSDLLHSHRVLPPEPMHEPAWAQFATLTAPMLVYVIDNYR